MPSLNRDQLPDVCLVQGHRNALEHIVDNLVGNAIRYTPEGGGITLELILGAEWIDLKVTDTGIGISKENQKRIFERFYRVDESRSRSEGATGLGLAIVKHLVIQIQGAIKVDSIIGRGSTFTVSLPCVAKTE